MPSLRHITYALIAATLFSAPAAAQWFSDRPAQCPAGTALSASGNCIKSSLPRRSANAKQAARRPKVVPPTTPPKGSCPKGAYAIKTKGGVLCSPATETGSNREKSCSNFNGGFSGWYRSQVAEYESLAKRNRDNEAAMRQHIDRQKIVERDLRRQTMRARQTGVRRELTAQWNAVRRDVKSNQSHLKKATADNRKDEENWKKNFKERLANKLRSRPAACKVAVAG